MIETVLKAIDAKRDRIIQSAQEMVQIPSPTHHEKELAAYLEQVFSYLGLRTSTNALGDVLGIAQGATDDPLLLMNTHLDQAGPGDMPDPFSGELMNGERFGVSGEVIYGRGINGQKASLAAMIAAAEAVLGSDVSLQRGFALHAGVLEECGGHVSPKHLIEVDKFPVAEVLCAEHTNLQVVNRQRGMIHIQLRIDGVGSHAASPEGASSALAATARVILGLDNLKDTLPGNPELGQALVSLNQLEVTPNIANMIPDVCRAVIDVRQPASISRDDITQIVHSAVDRALAKEEGITYHAAIEKKPVRSYTGEETQSDGCMYPFFTSEDEPLVSDMKESLRDICGHTKETALWSISSEAGYFATVAGLPVVAFGPGEDRFTHNQQEHVRVDDLMLCAKVFAAMIIKRCGSYP
jgi:acetylornithine deacetylase/succinyl-diaminopimelate desuccinylase-like protein